MMRRLIVAFLIVMALSTAGSGWATVYLVLDSVDQAEQRQKRRTEQMESAVENVTGETQQLGLCLMEQFTEHRIDNRGSHQADADHHQYVLPDPPLQLPEPRDEIQPLLLNACEPYLDTGQGGPAG